MNKTQGIIVVSGLFLFFADVMIFPPTKDFRGSVDKRVLFYAVKPYYKAYRIEIKTEPVKRNTSDYWDTSRSAKTKEMRVEYKKYVRPDFQRIALDFLGISILLGIALTLAGIKKQKE